LKAIHDVEAAGHAIGRFYDAALGKCDWSDALHEACRYLGFHAATLSSHDTSRRISRVELGAYNVDCDYTISFNQTYGALSPFALLTMMAPFGQPTSHFQYIDKNEFVASRFYKEWCAPQGYHEFLGAVIVREQGQLFAVGMVRLIDQPPISEEDLRRANVLIPHIIRAVNIARLFETLTQQRDDLLATIDSMPGAIVAVDGEQNVLSINKAGTVLCAETGVFSVIGGKLAMADPSHEAMVAAALKGRVFTPFSLPLPAHMGMTGQFLPITAKAHNEKRALLVLYPTAAIMPAPGTVLQKQFGITIAEMRIVALMLSGGTRATMAADLGVSLATVKTHLQSLFEKTGTKRQADLLRRIMGLAA
jgi:DNA-binding CsgD family transcriptional regulator